MGRRPGSKNKKTLEREQAQARLAAQAAPAPLEGGLLSMHREMGLPSAPVGDVDDDDVPSQEDFIEYPSPDGSWWRIELGAVWMEDFGTVREDAGAWHAAFLDEERGWRLVRLLYGVAPLNGEQNRDYMRPHDRDEVAEMMGIESGAVAGEIEQCRVFWTKWQRHQTTAPEKDGRAAAVGAEDETLGLVDATAIGKLLTTHGFDDLTREADRVYAAKRLEDLANKIDDDQGRPIAYQAIRLEIQLSLYHRLQQDAAKEKENARQVEDKLAWNKEIQALTNQQKSVNADYLTVMKALDATQAQNPSVRKKVAFRDCIAFCIEAIREFHANGNNALVDGVFTAAEIKILTTPLSLRPSQYRPDIVAVINDAMESHNLWDPNYVPPVMDRAVYRAFQRAWKDGLTAARAEGGLGVADMEEGLDGVDDVAPAEALPTPPPSQAGPGGTGGSVAPRGNFRPGDDVV